MAGSAAAHACPHAVPPVTAPRRLSTGAPPPWLALPPVEGYPINRGGLVHALVYDKLPQPQLACRKWDSGGAVISSRVTHCSSCALGPQLPPGGRIAGTPMPSAGAIRAFKRAVPSPGHHPPASPLWVQPTRPHCRYSVGSVTSPGTMRPPAEFQPQLATPPSPSTPRQWPSPAATCAGSGGTQLLSSYDTLRWQNRHAWAALPQLATHAPRAHTPLAGAQAAALPQEPAMLATSLHPQARAAGRRVGTDPQKLDAPPAARLRVDCPAVGRAWGQVLSLQIRQTSGKGRDGCGCPRQ